jgi:glutathione S-transferase
MLETEDGKPHCQSWAILRFLGRKYGYYPEDPVLAWKIDSTIDAAEDYFGAYFKFHFESVEDLKAQHKENWLKLLPVWVEAMEKRITKNGGKYIAGNNITIADFALASVIFNMLFNENNPHYAEAQAQIKGREVFNNYATLLR